MQTSTTWKRFYSTTRGQSQHASLLISSHSLSDNCNSACPSLIEIATTFGQIIAHLNNELVEIHTRATQYMIDDERRRPLCCCSEWIRRPGAGGVSPPPELHDDAELYRFQMFTAVDRSLVNALWVRLLGQVTWYSAAREAGSDQNRKNAGRDRAVGPRAVAVSSRRRPG